MSSGVEAALAGASVGGLIAFIGTLLSAMFADRRLRAEALKRDVEWRRALIAPPGARRCGSRESPGRAR